MPRWKIVRLRHLIVLFLEAYDAWANCDNTNNQLELKIRNFELHEWFKKHGREMLEELHHNAN